ncbi:L-serine ammonia-lyase, iron-sulfur-dependent subunit beta [Limibacter armeniacum]|uniref:L-serine ammonia-lyase, iron-sulfur-dependent subunit beta n=1 Tax=Limibacter armeniacum TaxID=466084 RepID=UPI002FE6114B
MEKSSIFDMIGPVMIGPSSSHTAGVVRIGRVGRKMLGCQPEEVTITFYNSFARTYEGHGSDRAIIAGLLDMKTDDDRIKCALDLAKEANLKYTFKPVGNASAQHPNTIRLQMKAGDKTAEVLGISRGGGLIKIKEVNGFSCNFSASTHTLIVLAEDQIGTISFIANVMSHDDCNIAEMTVSRKGKNDLACQFLEMDSAPREITLEYLRGLKWIREINYLPDIDL